jgi:hypothetical protein
MTLAGHGFIHCAGISEAVARQVLGGPVQYDPSDVGRKSPKLLGE